MRREAKIPYHRPPPCPPDHNGAAALQGEAWGQSFLTRLQEAEGSRPNGQDGGVPLLLLLPGEKRMCLESSPWFLPGLLNIYTLTNLKLQRKEGESRAVASRIAGGLCRVSDW